MSEETETPDGPQDPVGRVLHRIARVLAICGGLMLCALAALTTISVAGRSVLSMPVPGDFEMVAIGTGLAVFAFLPWCQLTRSNVIVDFFMTRAPVRLKAFCDLIGGMLYLCIGAILTWRMVYGGIDMYDYNEKSMTINFPRWTTFPPSVLMMAFLIVVVCYTVWRSFAEANRGEFFDDYSGPGG